MTRLPTPGGDNGNWGSILNDFLSTVHDTDGNLKNNSITKAKLATSVQTSLDLADNAIPASQKGAASGVATLNTSSKLTTSQLPDGVVREDQASPVVTGEVPVKQSDGTYTGTTATSTPDATATVKGKLALAGDLVGTADLPLVRPFAPVLGGTTLQSLLTETPMSPSPTFGTRTTGLSTGGLAAAALSLINSMSGGSYTSGQITRTEPNYAEPKDDTSFRIAGPFNYWGGSSATTQQVGQFQVARTNSSPDGGGMTGSYGEISYRFQGRYLVRVMRDTSGTQYVEFAASKNGGPMKPFRSLASQSGQEIFTAPGDGLYYLVPIDLGESADWQIKEYVESATFGGYYHLSASTLSYPNWRAGKLLVLGDSFSVPGQGQYRHSLGFIPMLGRSLGMDVHLSGQGGTGYRAKGFISFDPVVESNLLNYLERLPYDVDHHFDDSHQPDAIVVLGSQNDRSGEFDGTTALDNNIAGVLGGLYDRFPNVPILATGLMHTRTETWNSEYETINGQIKAYIDANPRMGIRYVRSLLQDGNTYGTGYQGNTNGTGPSDTLTWTDSSHPSAATTRALPGSDYLGSGGQGAIARKIRDEIVRQLPVRARSNAGLVASSSSLPTYPASVITSGTFNIARLPSDEVSKRRLVRRWFAKLDATNTASVADRTPGEGALPYAIILGQPGSARAVEYIDPADYAVSGKTTQFILNAFLQNGDVAISTGGFGVVLVETNAPTGGAAGAELSASVLATVTGSTAANWITTPIAANARLTKTDSSITPTAFSIASAKWIAPRIQNYSTLPANSSVIITVELYVVNN